MQTIVGSSTLGASRDPFSILRDTYALPKGYARPLEEYDYIIVGAGSSGCVLAARLTEDRPRAMVLLLEAGKPESLLSDIPILAPYWQTTENTWPYTMEHQPGVCLGSEEERCYWPRGRALGGSSVTNHLIYARGRPQDWDRIAAAGNYGWSYSDILPYYMKSERCELKKYKQLKYRGRDGDLSIEHVPYKTGLVQAFLEAGRMYGHPTVDYNSPDTLGFGYVQTTTVKGHRLSSAKAFLHPHKKRRNLHVLTEARVTKVLIDPYSKRAYAIEYTRNGINYTAHCRREIILSAGAISSPQLLMLSGVGPKEHLHTLGIPVIADLQVGRVLIDHIAFPGIIFKLNTTDASLIERKVNTLPNFIHWLHYGDGLLSGPAGIEAIGYVKSTLSDDPEPIPDIELISMGTSITYDAGGTFSKSWKITEKTYKAAFSSLNGYDTWSALVMLLYPKSRGYLELRNTNPFSFPKLYGNYLTDPTDIETIMAGIKYVIKLGDTTPFQKYGAKLHIAEYPMCRVHTMGSDAYWNCAIRTLVVSMRHHVGTCRMGPPTDLAAVVDPELRVYGVQGLRVVDTSVIPTTVAAHSTAPAVMIAEKGADMIKQTWAEIVVKSPS